MNILTPNDSLSGGSTKSSGSSSVLNEMRYSISYEDKKAFENSLNDEYMSFEGKDERYWERRRKNNAAAKRSRERRRQHDMELEEQIKILKLKNAVLQREINTLRQQNKLFECSRGQFELTQINDQNVCDSSTISTIPLDCKISDVIPIYISKEETKINTTDKFYVNNKNSTVSYNNDANPICLQNPLDLSCKWSKIQSMPGVENKNQSKAIYRSSTQVTQDQKYWDRRRRNNEAVRKCRQNKRARILNSMNNLKGDNDDKTQINIKINSITNELEKLKSHIKVSEQASIEFSSYPQMNLGSELENTRCTGLKALKWKTKLIEADQADKEMC